MTAPGSTASSEDVSSYKFTGKEEDEQTGLYYYGARYYDPALGRFITPDTVVPDYTNPQGLNRYAYCRNNPLIYIDPSGHFEFLSDATFSGFSGDAWSRGQNYWNQMAADWASGNYFDSFIDSASFFVNNGILLPASVAADGILTAPYNSGTNWSAGFVSGDWDRTLHGSAELGTIGFLGYLERLSSLSSLASLPSEGAEIASESGIKLLPAPSGYSPWGSEIRSVVAETDMTMFRVWGDEAGQVGAWLSPTKPLSSLSSIRDLALPPGNSAGYVSEVLVPACRHSLSNRHSSIGIWAAWRCDANFTS